MKKNKGLKYLSRNLIESEIEDILFLYENNIGYTEMSEHFNRDVSCIFRVIQKYKARRKDIKELLEERIIKD